MEDTLSARSLTPGAANRGVGFWKIVVWTGLLFSGALYMVDPLEPFADSAAPICRLFPGDGPRRGVGVQAYDSQLNGVARFTPHSAFFAVDVLLTGVSCCRSRLSTSISAPKWP